VLFDRGAPFPKRGAAQLSKCSRDVEYSASAWGSANAANADSNPTIASRDRDRYKGGPCLFLCIRHFKRFVDLIQFEAVGNQLLSVGLTVRQQLQHGACSAYMS
jgi:hypothetical protein